MRQRISLPWRLPLQIDLNDSIGRALASQGVYDLVTTEVLWRLAAPGDHAFDIGANIGYMTSVLALRAGPGGRVDAFEPHPKTCEVLRGNVRSWSARQDCARVQVHELALSSTQGSGSLDLVPGDEGNTGQAFLTAQGSTNAVQVRLARLEEFLAEGRGAAILKIDAEGHEAQVLTGAGAHLRGGRIRDVVFEETARYPAASHRILEDAGYTIFWFEERWRGPRIIPPHHQQGARRPYEIAPSFLATLDSTRAKRLLSAAGWQCL